MRHHALAGVTEDCAFGYLCSYIDNLLLIPPYMLGAGNVYGLWYDAIDDPDPMIRRS